MLFYVRSSPLPDLLCLSADILASVCAIVWNCQFHSKVVLIVRMKAIRAPLLLFGVHLSCVCVGGGVMVQGLSTAAIYAVSCGVYCVQHETGGRGRRVISCQ